MAKSGAEFLASNTKRTIDIVAASSVVGASLAPGMLAGALVGGENFRRSPSRLLASGLAPWLAVAVATCVEQQVFNPILSQPRVGREGIEGEPVSVRKFRTCFEDDLTGIVGGYAMKDLKPFAKALRRFGIDELPQVLDVLDPNVRAGFFGMRQVLASTLEQREKAAGPGLFSDYMHFYKIGSGQIGPDSVFAHKIQSYPENSPEAVKLMEIAVAFAASQSVETTIDFVLGLPQDVQLSVDEMYTKYTGKS